jgi:hypothetical protein
MQKPWELCGGVVSVVHKAGSGDGVAKAVGITLRDISTEEYR